MRSRTHPGRLVLLGALLLARPAGLRAEEGSGAAAASVRLPSGGTARYEYHFNRNALRASHQAGDALIALTSSGNLLRFDLGTRRLTREWFGPSRVVCLGRGAGDAVLAGFEDGRVCRVDPATLERTEVARLPGKPQWIGFAAGDERGPGGLVAVYERPRWVEQDGQRWRQPCSIVRDLASGREVAADGLATAFLLDSRRRLWLGADRGEWGGWCSCVDLGAGTLRAVPGIRRIIKELGIDQGEVWDGVYGFIELPDGPVWAYGGVLHMGFGDAFLRRVDAGKAEELYRSEGQPPAEDFGPNGEVPRTLRPWLPITHILPDGGDALLVFTVDAIFRTDRKLSAWTRVRDLRFRSHWGRPDAVGVYPALTTVHRLEGAGGGLLCATALDGYVLVRGEDEVRHTLAGQLGSDDIVRADVVDGRTLFREWDGQLPPWRYEGGRWELAPPPEVVEADPFGGAGLVFHRPSRSCVDGLGRPWVALRGLRTIDARAGWIQDFEALPMLGAETRVLGVYPDRATPGGIIAMLEGRGVVFVRVGKDQR
jgi:hypothetical protein